MKEYFQKTFKEKKAVLNGKGCISMIALATTAFNCQAMSDYIDTIGLDGTRFHVTRKDHINCQSKDLGELYDKITECAGLEDDEKKDCLSHVAVSFSSFNEWREEVSKHDNGEQSLIPILQGKSILRKKPHKIKITVTEDDFRNYETAGDLYKDLDDLFLEKPKDVEKSEDVEKPKKVKKFAGIKKILKIQITEEPKTLDIFRILRLEDANNQKTHAIKKEVGKLTIESTKFEDEKGNKKDKNGNENVLLYISLDSYKRLVNDSNYQPESVPFKVNIRHSDLPKEDVYKSYLTERHKSGEPSNFILTIYSTEKADYDNYKKNYGFAQFNGVMCYIGAIDFIIADDKKATEFLDYIRTNFGGEITVYKKTCEEITVHSKTSKTKPKTVKMNILTKFGILPNYIEGAEITRMNTKSLDGYEGYLKLKEKGYSSLLSTVVFKSLADLKGLKETERLELKEKTNGVKVICSKDEKIDNNIDFKNLGELKVGFGNDDSLDAIVELKRKYKDKITIVDSKDNVIDLQLDSDIDQICSIDDYLVLKKYGLQTDNRVLGFQSCQKFKQVLEEQFHIQIDQKHKIEEKLKELRSQVKDIEIAFAKEDCKGFRETEIPWYATKVKANAFDDGATIEKITVESTGTIFEKDSLRKLSSLNEIRIPGSITPKEFYEKLLAWDAGVKSDCVIISEFCANPKHK